MKNFSDIIIHEQLLPRDEVVAALYILSQHFKKFHEWVKSGRDAQEFFEQLQDKEDI